MYQITPEVISSLDDMVRVLRPIFSLYHDSFLLPEIQDEYERYDLLLEKIFLNIPSRCGLNFKWKKKYGSRVE